MSFDRWLFRIFLLSLCVLGIAQGLLRFESLRRVLSPAVRLEGVPLEEGFPALEEGEPVWYPTYLGPHESGYDGVVVLKMTNANAPGVWVLQNGFPLKVLRPEDGVVWVKDGDLLGIYAPNQTVRIVVSGVSENVTFPQVGFEVEGNHTFGLFRVGIKAVNQQNGTPTGSPNSSSNSTGNGTTDQRDMTPTR
ncbi:MAG: hypothetical protein IMW97_06780 [Firmicutes bacterium]|nr:hypothetical protein [Candidatus Fermentithermobacillaceae bacterium]